MSKIPMSASRLALVVGGMPWSWAAGMKWVPISPLVDQPQIQKEPNRIQKMRLAAGLPQRAEGHGRRLRAGAAPAASGGRVRPPRRTPWCRRRRVRRAAPHQTSGTSSSAKPLTSPAAHRQPGPSASCAIAGRNTSWPVELAAEKTPTTTPRCRTNHRLATIAPKTSASEPVPMPTAKPHSSHSCQAPFITSVRPGADRDQEQGGGDHPADAEPLHERGRERRRQAVDDQVEGDRAAGGGPRPAELLLQRLEQRAGRGAEAGGGDQRGHRDRRDPPGRWMPRRVRGSSVAVTGRFYFSSAWPGEPASRPAVVDSRPGGGAAGRGP